MINDKYSAVVLFSTAIKIALLYYVQHKMMNLRYKVPSYNFFIMVNITLKYVSSLAEKLDS